MEPFRHHTNIYVSRLPLEIDETLLLGLFESFGPVESIRIFKSPGEVENADAAIAALNGANISGSSIELRHADHDAEAAGRSPPPSDNIYCKNLPAGFGDPELRQLFSLFGQVTTCRVLHQGDATGQGGAALVRFASVADAAHAVQALQGHRVVGSLHPLTVRFADSEQVKAKKQAKQVNAALSALSLQQQQDGVVAAQQQQLQQQQQQQSYNPYGFLGVASLSHPGFSDPSALGLGQPQDVGLGSDCAHLIGRPSQPPPSSVFMGPGNRKMEWVAGSAAPSLPALPALTTLAVSSLYVKNLPVGAGKLFLYEAFSPYGPILSVKILTDEHGVSKGVGFVNFSSADCAAKAVAALHNLPLGDRNLHVTFQTHKKMYAVSGGSC